MSRYFLWNNIKVPSDSFVDEYLKLTGVYLAASNAKFYHHVLSRLSCIFMVDIIAIDKFFDDNDVDYDSLQSTYKNEECSLREYTLRKFGQRVVEMTEQLTNGNFELDNEEAIKNGN